MNNLQGQYFVEIVRVVSSPSQMALYERVERFSFNIGPRKTVRVKQHFSNVSSEIISIPSTKVEHFVPAQE